MFLFVGMKRNALTENEKDVFNKEEIKLKMRRDSKNIFSRILCIPILHSWPKSKI